MPESFYVVIVGTSITAYFYGLILMVIATVSLNGQEELPISGSMLVRLFLLALVWPAVPVITWFLRPPS